MSLFSEQHSAVQPATEGLLAKGLQPPTENSRGGARVDVLPLNWIDPPPLAGCPCLRPVALGVVPSPAVNKATAWADAHGWSRLQLCCLQHAQVGYQIRTFNFGPMNRLRSVRIRFADSVPERGFSTILMLPQPCAQKYIITQNACTTH